MDEGFFFSVSRGKTGDRGGAKVDRGQLGEGRVEREGRRRRRRRGLLPFFRPRRPRDLLNAASSPSPSWIPASPARSPAACSSSSVAPSSSPASSTLSHSVRGGKISGPLLADSPMRLQARLAILVARMAAHDPAAQDLTLDSGRSRKIILEEASLPPRRPPRPVLRSPSPLLPSRRTPPPRHHGAGNLRPTICTVADLNRKISEPNPTAKPMNHLTVETDDSFSTLLDHAGIHPTIIFPPRSLLHLHS